MPHILGTLCIEILYCLVQKSDQVLNFQVTTPGVKQGPVSQSASQQAAIADKQQGHEPASPRSLQRSR